MRAVLGWLTRPVPLARVAAFRALVYAFIIWDVLFNFDDVIQHSYVPELYQPTLLARLVHVLQGLERQHCGADIGGLAVPHQLHLALVLEQQEPVALRQRLAGLDELDQVALLVLGQRIDGLVHGFWYSVKPDTRAANDVGG